MRFFRARRTKALRGISGLVCMRRQLSAELTQRQEIRPPVGQARRVPFLSLEMHYPPSL
jgi:hypothetical protein